MEAGREMAVEMALLGLLRQEPRHGYDLAREFAPDTVLGDIVHLETSLLYANLKKLERDGLVTSTIEQRGPRPPRRMLSLTEQGEQHLDQWLAEPVARTRDVRLEFLLKLYIARLIAPDLIQRLIVEQQEVCKGFIASLDEQLVDEVDAFRRLVLEMRLAQNRALLGWLQQAQSEVTV
jgi:DNA-binding PadR family transcriptional regulator